MGRFPTALFKTQTLPLLCPTPGRVVVSDHGAFVLINVYVPNAGDRPARPRLGFKLKFLHALKRTADGFRKQGRQVGWG